MRILHIGKSFPDARIEKTIYLDILRGDLPAIVQYNTLGVHGLKNIKCKQYTINVGRKEIFGFGRLNVQKQLQIIINEFDPDILHVHDIFNAIFVYGLDIPWIYNDHEGWSIESQYKLPPSSKFSPKFWWSYTGWKLKSRNISKWESKILKNRVSITVSEGIKKLHNTYGATGYVMHNFPLFQELPTNINISKVFQSLVYIGGDLMKQSSLYRNTSGFFDIANKHHLNLHVFGDKLLQSTDTITSHGFIPHSELYNAIKSFQFGLLPYHKHPFQSLADPNKAYLYTHLGLIVIAPSTYNLPHISAIRTFEKLSEITDIIKKPITELEQPEIIIKHAREEIIWDNYASLLQNIITTAIENF